MKVFSAWEEEIPETVDFEYGLSHLSCQNRGPQVPRSQGTGAWYNMYVANACENLPLSECLLKSRGLACKILQSQSRATAIRRT
jgi:hypothetical protein